MDVAASGAQDAPLDVLLGNGDGSFRAGMPVLAGGQVPIFGLVSARIDGDSHPDLVYIDGAGAGGVLRGKGDGTFESAQPFSFGSQPGGLGVADVDEDGALDLVIPEAGGPHDVAVLHAR